MSFREELERRSVFRVGAAYLIVAWFVAQVVDVLGNPLQLPDWFDTVIVVLLAAGLPIALVLAWGYELTSSGIERAPLAAAAVPRRISGQKLNYVVTGLLVLGFIIMAADVYVLGPRAESADRVAPTPALAASVLASESSSDTGIEAAVPTRARAGSIAVLPFEDLSPSPDNAFITAGLYEEFSTQLSTLKDLHVVARESASQYASDVRSMREIADELGVEAVVEASVSYADERLALSVRLREGVSGAILWSKRYNRPFADVFDIRADIARNIASTLAITISPAEQTRFARALSQSPAAYALYLRALAAFQSGFDLEALELLNRALVVEPNLAPAFARKAEHYALGRRHSKDAPGAEDAAPPDDLALQNAERALELDPESGRAWYVRGLVHQRYWRWDLARDDFKRAFELGGIELADYAAFLVHSGERDRALEVADELVAENPKHALAHYWRGYVLARTGALDLALAAFETAAQIAPMSAEIQRGIAAVLLDLGDRAGAEQALRTSGRLLEDKHRARLLPWLAYMYARLGRTEDVQRLTQEYRATRQPGLTSIDDSMWLHVALGETDAALAWLASAVDAVARQQRFAGTATVLNFKDGSPHDSTLEDPAFEALRRRLRSLLEK